MNRERFLNTGRITEVDTYTLLGLEAAAVMGPVSLQGELIRAHVDRFGGEPAVALDGWYAFVSWFPTGESRPYAPSQAEFGRIIPARDAGALELALRYSKADLNDPDAGVEGGKGEVVTFGVNWYANPSVRLAMNLSRVENDVFGDADGDLVGADSFTALQVRLQFVS